MNIPIVAASANGNAFSLTLDILTRNQSGVLGRTWFMFPPLPMIIRGLMTIVQV